MDFFQKRIRFAARLFGRLKYRLQSTDCRKVGNFFMKKKIGFMKSCVDKCLRKGSAQK